MFGKLIDDMLAPMFPHWALSRLTARAQYEMMLSTYGAAAKTRQNRDWVTPNVSADEAIINDLSVLIPRSRQMARDNGYMRSAIKAYVRNVVGIGITPRAATKFSSGKSRKKDNDAINDVFWDWSTDPKLCDIEQHKTFIQIQRMAVQHLAEVGEFFIVLGQFTGERAKERERKKQ